VLGWGKAPLRDPAFCPQVLVIPFVQEVNNRVVHPQPGQSEDDWRDSCAGWERANNLRVSGSRSYPKRNDLTWPSMVLLPSMAVTMVGV